MRHGMTKARAVVPQTSWRRARQPVTHEMLSATRGARRRAAAPHEVDAHSRQPDVGSSDG
jgi:hypothetical protein